MRLIDADALISEIKKDAEKAIEQDDKIGSFWLGYFAGSVINQPTIQPVATDTNVGDKISRQAAIDAAKHAWAKGLEPSQYIEIIPSAQQEQRWIPCSERLPENRVCVIVCFREWQQYANRYIYSIVTGWYARKHSVRENVFCEWEADCDYDEDEDEYYILEGWYEFTTQGNADLMNWHINAEVVAWMPLPEPYSG